MEGSGRSLEYSTQFALAQIPVSFRLGSGRILIHPLRLRDVLVMEAWLRDRFIEAYEERASLLDREEDREAFLAGVYPTVPTLSFMSGPGHDFLCTDLPSIVHLVWLMGRGLNGWTEERVLEEFRRFDLDGAVSLMLKMRVSVWKEPPAQAKLAIADRRPKYEMTDDEVVARVYHSLADKFHWGYEQVLDLTEYQIAWYLHLFPEEREHIEELDAMSHRSERQANGNPDVPYQPGTIHFNSPEEYEAWKAKRAKINNQQSSKSEGN